MDVAAFLSTLWAQVMLAMLPLYGLHRLRNGRWPLHRLRTWAALFGASVLAWIVTPAVGETPFVLYALICLSAGAIARISPAGTAQRAIALMFALMAAFHVGAYLAGSQTGGPIYYAMLQYAGWSQLVILLFWGCKNVGFGALAGRWLPRLGHRSAYPLGNRGDAG